MKKVTIIQNNIQESVGSAVVEKLYRLAFEDPVNEIVSQLDPTSNISGNILVSAAYEDSVRYLSGIDTTDTPRFPNLHITVQNNNYYVRFTESVIQQAAANLYGDGIGITSTQLASIRDKYSLNKGYNKTLLSESAASEIHTLEDFQYFTNILDYVSFIYLPNITTTYDKIKFPATTIYCSRETDGSVVKTDQWNNITINHVDWNGATFSFDNASGLTVPTNYVFKNINIRWHEGLIPNRQTLPPMFRGNRILDIAIYPEGVQSMCGSFHSCYLTYLELPTTITNINDLLVDYRRDGNVSGNTGCIVIKAVTPPSFLRIQTTNARSPQYIYVPDGSVNAYKLAFSGYSDIIKPMSQMSQAELDKGTVTQEDIDRT